MSDEKLINDLLHTIKLDSLHRGQIAELAFMRKAANLGFSVAKPWGDADRYDVIVRVGRTFWRVQVKSVLGKAPSKLHYRVITTGGRKGSLPRTPYSREQIDFLVAYIFPEDIWYVFPAHVIENHTCVCVTPGSKKSRSEKYREAWKLMNDTTTEHGSIAEPAPTPGLDRVEEIFAVAGI